MPDPEPTSLKPGLQDREGFRIEDGEALSYIAEVQGRLEGMAIGLRWPEHREPDPEYLERMAADLEKARRLLFPFMYPTFLVVAPELTDAEADKIRADWKAKHGA